MNKSVIWIGATIGGTIGSVIGSMVDHSPLGLWGIMLGGVGGIAGIWAAYKIQQ